MVYQKPGTVRGSVSRALGANYPSVTGAIKATAIAVALKALAFIRDI